MVSLLQCPLLLLVVLLLLCPSFVCCAGLMILGRCVDILAFCTLTGGRKGEGDYASTVHLRFSASGKTRLRGE